MGDDALDDRRPAVSIEVSGLRDGGYEERRFIAGLLDAVRAIDALDATAWSLRRLDPTDRDATAPVAHKMAARAARITQAVGLAPPARWMGPRGAVVHLAGGPRHVRMNSRGVVTVHRVDEPDPGGAPWMARLTRAVGNGAIVHAVTTDVRDRLCEAGIDRAAIAVAAPGITVPHAAQAVAKAEGRPVVAVMASVPSPEDADLVARLHATSLVEPRLVTPDATADAACVVTRTQTSAFPVAELEALARGVPVVARRTHARAELLSSASSLVDDDTELVELCVELATSSSARAIAVAAGRARARDFAWSARIGDIRSIYCRAGLCAPGPGSRDH